MDATRNNHLSAGAEGPPDDDEKGSMTRSDKFGMLVGIHSYGKVKVDKAENKGVFSTLFASPTDRNHGVYLRAVSDERSARIAFRTSTVLIDTIYLLQVVVAAALTGLSAYSDHRTALTVLGAINTVLAALMAWLKGQGMPNRYLKARERYADVVRSAEMEAGMFALETEERRGGTDDIVFQAKKLQAMYNDAKKAELDNHPDVYAGNQAKTEVTLGGKTVEKMSKVLEELSQRMKTLETRDVGGAIPQSGLSGSAT
ncbi:hypothetical protein LTR36_005413 [Oleoguttula mirabilis]|uniref:SMODS and SLOG-associating 2TM effector domain-containing protein n=1 Tax=Oleoguttula mirabilis TaxID=1507867 RepID=A0AAV9JES3_9PEZI|nr:hypothetical protein LTR36_005413 [Oleoguttula mirabilis]